MRITFTLLIWLIAQATARIQTNLSEVNIKISLIDNPLPASIQSILTQSQLNKIKIKMGHLPETYMPSYPRAITALLYNYTTISEDQIYLLSTIFGFKYTPAFQIYLPDEGVTLISDPNDRLCIEQIQLILKFMFPCKNYVGLGLDFLLNLQKLLKGFFAMEVVWIPGQIDLKFFFLKQKEWRREYFRSSTCGSIQYKQWQKQDNFLMNTKEQRSIVKNSVIYRSAVLNQWYNPKKTISHIIESNNSTNNSQLSLKIITRLPIGFYFRSTSIYPLDQRYKMQNNTRAKETFFIIDIELPLKAEKAIFQLHFQAALPGFEQFQTIAGGGEEIMNVPLLLENGNIQQLNGYLVSQRLLEPDFSIPFHAITFTTALIGYLWLTLWRSHRFSSTNDPIFLEDSE